MFLRALCFKPKRRLLLGSVGSHRKSVLQRLIFGSKAVVVVAGPRPRPRCSSGSGSVLNKNKLQLK